MILGPASRAARGLRCVIVLNSFFNCSIEGWDLWFDVISSLNAARVHLYHYFRIAGPSVCIPYKYNLIEDKFNLDCSKVSDVI